MRKQIKRLEDHSNLSADSVNIFQITGQLNTVDDYLSFLMLFEKIDAAD